MTNPRRFFSRSLLVRTWCCRRARGVRWRSSAGATITCPGWTGTRPAPTLRFLASGTMNIFTIFWKNLAAAKQVSFFYSTRIFANFVLFANIIFFVRLTKIYFSANLECNFCFSITMNSLGCFCIVKKYIFQIIIVLPGYQMHGLFINTPNRIRILYVFPLLIIKRKVSATDVASVWKYYFCGRSYSQCQCYPLVRYHIQILAEM